MSEKAHASLMDGVYRYQRHFYDFTRKYYLLGRDRMLDALDVPGGGSVLEVGCGTGRNLIRAAKKYPDANFYGVDISDEMLKTARANVQRAGLSGKVQLKQADATSFSPAEIFDRSDFDRAFISYALSMIPDWRGTISHTATLLNEAGSLHIVDFGQQEDLPRWFRSLLFSWLDKFHVEPRAEMGTYLEEITDDGSKSASYESIYKGYAVLGVVHALAR